PPTTIAIGEISLAGEIRPVTQANQRSLEAKRLGFEVVLDKSNVSISQALQNAFSSKPTRAQQPVN
ncbi:MAG: DNA repair protein RadA, partial [Microbacteriaceae bacterium]|nr:DNA repair protein RadA [Microbacteriaceae bacterium]